MSTISWMYGPDGTEGRSWNPVTGCAPVSPGCLNCYAATLASRGMCEDHRGLTRITKRRNRQGELVRRPVFNGTVHLHAGRLDDPRKWKKPRRVFVNSMSDLFHESVPYPFIAAVYKTMAECPQHTFLVLTKRPLQALAWYAWARTRGEYFEEAAYFGRNPRPYDPSPHSPGGWPLFNVHLGVSAENQSTFDRRITFLLQCPARVRWVSAEPLLGPLDLRAHLTSLELPGLDWVVVGGESGAAARPMQLAWVERIVRDSRWCGVPVFVKQLGSRPMLGDKRVLLEDGKGETASEWPNQNLVIRELP